MALRCLAGSVLFPRFTCSEKSMMSTRSTGWRMIPQTACDEALCQLNDGQLSTKLHCWRIQVGSHSGWNTLCNRWPCILAYWLQSPLGSDMTTHGALLPFFNCPSIVPAIVALTLVQTNGGDVARAIVDLLNVYIQRQRRPPSGAARPAPGRPARF